MRSESRRDEIERLVPRDGFPPAAVAPDGPRQPVGIVVNVDERHRLRADVAAAEGVGRIAADADDLVPARADLEAADGLAQVAGAIGDAFLEGQAGHRGAR